EINLRNHSSLHKLFYSLCFLLDEPLANIYPELQSDLLKLLQEIAQVNLVIIISHDLKLNENTKNIRIE
ncbi:MAG: hypothetical protein N4Q05_08245, partial [Lactobacillus crispatus]|nr:hypothetical protein [Lactobacillus crispatus]